MNKLKRYFKRVHHQQKIGLRNVLWATKHEFIKDMVMARVEMIEDYNHVFKLIPLLAVLFGVVQVLIAPVVLPICVVVLVGVVTPIKVLMEK